MKWYILTNTLLQVIDEFLPSFLVDAEWSSSNYAHLGNTLKPKKLQDAPSLTLTSPGSSSGESCHALTNMTYTVTITDPDAPSRDDPKWSEFCHWIATGLSVSADVEGGSTSTCSSAPLTLSLANLDEVMPYYPPGPPEKTGKHRYIFLVFTPENGTTDALNLSKPGDRKHWGYEYEGERVGVGKWAKENGLIPVGECYSPFRSRKLIITDTVYYLKLRISFMLKIRSSSQSLSGRAGRSHIIDVL